MYARRQRQAALNIRRRALQTDALTSWVAMFNRSKRLHEREEQLTEWRESNTLRGVRCVCKESVLLFRN